jgi:hypothetical protein
MVVRICVYLFAGIGFITVVVFFAMRLNLTKANSAIDNQEEGFLQNESPAPMNWQKTEEWNTLKIALSKDASSINTASQQTGIPPRVIASIVVVEQLRVFFSEREVFENYFSPLKVLGNQTQFSWGILGLKEETAKKIEEHLVDKDSVFYLGSEYEHLLDFSTKDHNKERFERITKKNDRYFSYLYASLYIKQIETQWKKAGYPIEKNIGVIATLYNIGFEKSVPKLDPNIGGALIDLEDYTGTFGRIALDFYNSNELEAIFPK